MDTPAENMSTRERLGSELKQKAERIFCVHNDVFTLRIWQLFLNSAIGLTAMVMLVLSMIITESATQSGLLIGGIVAVIAAFIVYFIFKARLPMSFQQYTVVEKGRRYIFQIVNKNRSLFSDGERVVEVDRLDVREDGELVCGELCFDFFADMSVDVRIGKYDKEIYKGTVIVDGKRKKAKIVFKNNEPVYGVVDGMRIKYFDVNDKKSRFVVPVELKRAALACNVDWPKLHNIETQ